MRKMHIRFSKFCGALLLCLGVVACGGGGGGSSLADDAVSAVLTFLSGGAFSDLDSLVVALEGDKLVIKDFGGSELGTNPGLLPLGSALVSGISCGATSCTGQVLVPSVTNGILQSSTRETGTIAQEGDNSFVVSSPSLGSKTFKKYELPTNPPTTLDRTASCAQWWAAVGNRTWTFVSANDLPGHQGA